MLLGVKAGLPLRTLADFLESGVGAGRGLPFDVFEKHVFPGEFERIPGGNGNVYRWVKDVGCAQEVAWDTNSPTPLLTITEDILKRTIALGLGDEVNFATIKVLEDWAGVELRTEAKQG
jgi:3-hydroxyisobutyrate dehydrogenase-like beta-hydroxyacid dehydrogenase